MPVPHLGHLAGVEEVCPLQGDVDLVQAGEVAVPEVSIVIWSPIRGEYCYHMTNQMSVL